VKSQTDKVLYIVKYPTIKFLYIVKSQKLNERENLKVKYLNTGSFYHDID